MKTILLLTLTFTLLLGCGTTPEQKKQPSGRIGHLEPGHLGSLSIGMSKAEVIRTLGRPESIAADSAGETLLYVEERPWWQWKTIAIQIKDGKVTQFGERQ